MHAVRPTNTSTYGLFTQSSGSYTWKLGWWLTVELFGLSKAAQLYGPYFSSADYEQGG